MLTNMTSYFHAIKRIGAGSSGVTSVKAGENECRIVFCRSYVNMALNCTMFFSIMLGS